MEWWSEVGERGQDLRTRNKESRVRQARCFTTSRSSSLTSPLKTGWYFFQGEEGSRKHHLESEGIWEEGKEGGQKVGKLADQCQRDDKKAFDSINQEGFWQGELVCEALRMIEWRVRSFPHKSQSLSLPRLLHVSDSVRSETVSVGRSHKVQGRKAKSVSVKRDPSKETALNLPLSARSFNSPPNGETHVIGISKGWHANFIFWSIANWEEEQVKDSQFRLMTA